MKNFSKKIIVWFLQAEAQAVIRRYKPKIIGVTGSVGKTTTKDLIYSVLSGNFSVRKNIKSFNSDIGMPLTVLDLPNAWLSPFAWLKNLLLGFWKVSIYYLLSITYPKYLVLELSADHPGDIKSPVSWLKPEIGVITGFGNEIPVHAEFFHNIESLIEEKGELLKVLPENGVAILNIDDARVWGMRGNTRAHIISYGFDQEAKIRGDGFHISYNEEGLPKGIGFRIDYEGKSVPVRLSGVLGKGHAYAALAATAVAVKLGMNLVAISQALSEHVFSPGRMRILDGLRGVIIIDDTYNSSPAAVKIALEAIHELKSGRKIVVLGDMLELGKYSESEHKKVGTWVRGVTDTLVCVGERAKVIGESAITDGFVKNNVHFFSDSYKTGNFLKDFVTTGDMVLLKASQSIRLERATEMLMANPSQASELLVRQEKEWKKR